MELGIVVEESLLEDTKIFSQVLWVDDKVHQSPCNVRMMDALIIHIYINMGVLYSGNGDKMLCHRMRLIMIIRYIDVLMCIPDLLLLNGLLFLLGPFPSNLFLNHVGPGSIIFLINSNREITLFSLGNLAAPPLLTLVSASNFFLRRIRFAFRSSLNLRSVLG